MGRKKERNRFVTKENKMMVEGRCLAGWVKQEMGIKKGTCDEHRVLYGSVQSLYRTPEARITLYVNGTGNKT